MDSNNINYNVNNSNNKSILITIIIIAIIAIVGLMAFNVIDSPFSNNDKEITFSEKNIRLEKNKSVQLSLISKNNNVRYKSSNNNIATVNELTGYVTGINNGTATITAYLTNNDKVYDECIIEVYSISNNGGVPVPTPVPTPKDPTPTPVPTPTPSKPQIEKLIISNSKISVYVGKTLKISYRIEPTNGEIRSIKWTSSNNSIATVTNNGTVKGIKEGTATITLNINNNLKGNISVTVKKESVAPSETALVSNGKIWGYTDNKMVNPLRASESFFKGLVNKGIGKISGNSYSYSGYTYDFSKSILTYNRRQSLIRIYYPKGLDLSNVNTFTLLGGTSERNMGGMFSTVDKDTSKIKSSGIIILVSTSGSYHYQDAINATNFVKTITKQKTGKRNSIGGYSLGGPAAGGAMVYGNYDRLFILHSKVELTHTSKLKDKKIYVYSPNGDKLADSTRTTLTALKNDGARKNVTLVTNSSSMIKTFGDYFTIVNPGSAQGSGHGYANFINGNVFAFACSN